MDHLDSLQLLLSHEKERFRKAKTVQEKQLRSVWVKQLEKEIADEVLFLGLTDNLPKLTDDELLAELMK